MAGTANGIDLNADGGGESFGRRKLSDDSALLPMLASANVARGFHAGDALTLRRTVTEAAEHGVAVTPHISFRGLSGLGRREMAVAPDELAAADVLHHIGALEGLCRNAGTAVPYFKPHGALYHHTRKDPAGGRAGGSRFLPRPIPPAHDDGGKRCGEGRSDNRPSRGTGGVRRPGLQPFAG